MRPAQHRAMPDSPRPTLLLSRAISTSDGVRTLRIPFQIPMWSATTAPGDDSPAFALVGAYVNPPPESNRRPHPYHRCAGGSRRYAAPHVATQPRRWEGASKSGNVGQREDACSAVSGKFLARAPAQSSWHQRRRHRPDSPRPQASGTSGALLSGPPTVRLAVPGQHRSAPVGRSSLLGAAAVLLDAVVTAGCRAPAFCEVVLFVT
jgi:hypothetical protein